MKKTTRQANQEKWFLHIAQFLSKGISQDSYCQAEGLKKGTFSYWLRKYRSRLVNTEDWQENSGGFISLRRLESPSIDSEITFRVGAVALSFPGHQNLEALIPLIKALV